MPEKKFLNDSEIQDIERFANEVYGDDTKKSAALAAKVNDWLTGRYANMNTVDGKGVYSIGPDGQFRKH
jgi:hypothetical protein